MKWDLEGVVINKKLFPCSTPTEVEKSATSSGADNTVTFSTNERKPLTSLDITIEPSQEGSGDPSPDNVRPLVSYDKVTAKLQKGTTKVKEVVSFGSTVYGLTGDCVTGEFEETHGFITFDGSENWQENTTGVYYIGVSDMNELSNCNIFGVIDRGSSSGLSDLQCRLNSLRTNINFKNTSITSLADWKTFVENNNIQIAYELATPSELTTTPLVLTTFAGEQTIKFDEKIPFTMKYLTLEGDSCDKAKQFLPLFYNKERRSL